LVSTKAKQPPPYEPRPIATGDVKLPSVLLELTEELARNAHDLWAAGRIKEGWTWGPARDDAKRLHPCLVSYEELPESEKEYDRSAALGTLKAIIALGYTVRKNDR
jgi:hypothetical protein